MQALHRLFDSAVLLDGDWSNRLSGRADRHRRSAPSHAAFDVLQEQKDLGSLPSPLIVMNATSSLVDLTHRERQGIE